MKRSLASFAVLAAAGIAAFVVPEQAAGQMADASPARSAVQRFVLDPANTYVGFNARHMLVTNVKGRFHEVRGFIDLDTSDVTRSVAYVEIGVASIDTENERRDEHLRSDDFFDAALFPHIIFRGTRVERRGDDLRLYGELTIRDVTRAVAIPFELTGPVSVGDAVRLGAEGTLRINRFDYGIQWSRTIETGGGLVVGPDIRIEFFVDAAAEQPR